MIKSAHLYILFCFTALLLIWADVSEAQEVGSSQSPLTHSDTLWDRLTIPVCWELPSGFTLVPFAGDQREWTKNAVESSWEAVSNINFVGWNNCNDGSRGIRVAWADEGPHVEELGVKLDGLANGMVLNNVFKEWDPTCAETVEIYEFCIRAIAVHEFGHALGFAHEHNRSDRRLCSAEPQGTNPTFLITSYDPESIMNYCSIRWNNDGNLSPMDVAGVRMTYGPFLPETPAQIEVIGTIFAVDDETIGNETGSEDYQFTINLTDEQPNEQQRRSLCVGGEVRVELDVRATLSPGSNEVVVNSRSRLYEGRSCNTSDLEARDQSVLTLSPSISAATTRHSLRNGGAGGGDYAEINLQFTRLTGDETAGADCTSCRDAAREARFAKPQATTSAANYTVTKKIILRNVTSQKCLSFPSSQKGSGDSFAVIKSCKVGKLMGNKSYQVWSLKEIKTGKYSIHSPNKKFCLNLKKSQDDREGGPVKLVRCSGHPDQLWQKLVDPTTPDTFRFRNVASGKCLNVHGGRENKEGGKVSVYSCSSSKDQQWKVFSGTGA